MFLPDVNVLLYAHRAITPEHDRYRAWLDGLLNADEPFALSEAVLSSVIRIATNPRILNPPSTLADALLFVETLRSAPNCVVVSPGSRHWDIFTRLCLEANARGDLVPDAYLAALAIESGSECVTTDRAFARFPTLRWRHPLQ